MNESTKKRGVVNYECYDGKKKHKLGVSLNSCEHFFYEIYSLQTEWR